MRLDRMLQSKNPVKIILYFSLLIVVPILTASCNQKDKDQNMSTGTTFYVGTYTEKQSEGIYTYSLFDDGTLALVGLAAEAENPSFLTKSTDGRILIAVNENEAGTVSSFKILGDSLQFMNQQSSGGKHPCFVAINDAGSVLTANYSSGTVGLLQLMDDGAMSSLLDVQQHEGQGSHERQDGPHAHSVWFAPDGLAIISVDLGTNELVFSTLDPQNQKLQPAAQQSLKMEPGAGPRHLAFHPEQSWAYVINELNSTISRIQKDENGYSLKTSYSTLPEGYSGENYTADIHISKDGRFLYASNRGHNSIAIFAIENDGNLVLKGHESTRGEWPRNFALSPDDAYLLVANQHSDNIVSFKVEPDTGRLEFVSEIHAHTPVCILF